MNILAGCTTLAALVARMDALDDDERDAAWDSLPEIEKYELTADGGGPGCLDTGHPDLDSLLVRGTVVGLHGQAKLGKTSFLLAWLANADYNLTWVTEEGPAVWRERARRLPSLVQDGVHIGPPRASWPETAFAAQEQLENAIVVLDSLRAVLLNDAPAGAENDAVVVGQRLNDCGIIARKLNTTVVVVHHDGKAGGYSGSTAFYGACDTLIHLTAGTGRQRKLGITSRLAGLPEALTVDVSPTFDLRVLTPAAGQTAPAEANDRPALPADLQTTLDALKRAGHAISADELKAATGFGRTKSENLAKELQAKGLVSVTHAGRKVWYAAS